MKVLPLDIMQRMEQRLLRLYGETLAPRLSARLVLLAGRYCKEPTRCIEAMPRWDQRDAILVTDGDMLHCGTEKPLSTLARFLSERLHGIFPIVHLLPFYLSAADNERAVIDYKCVKPTLGDWDDIRTIGMEYKLMFDLPLNQVSKQSEWFTDYINGIEPARKYFISIDPSTDLAAVMRPCTRPVLMKTVTRRGERHLWSTYADNQVDVNFANPDVLFEFLDIVLFYADHGARIICLNDAAFLWKCPGTCCVGLPETHELIRLFRDLLSMVAPEVLLLAETRLPHRDNIDYFGNGDEGQLIYHNCLPGLLVQALLTGSSRHLTKWARSLPIPPPGCTFVNPTGSEIGISLAPLDGVLGHKGLQQLVRALEQRGAIIAMHVNREGQEAPYEAEIGFFHALSDLDRAANEHQIARLLCAQTILLALKGIPAIYFNDLIVSEEWLESTEGSEPHTPVNQWRWEESTLTARLDLPGSVTARVFQQTLAQIRVRQDHLEFHPDGEQQVLSVDDGLFVLRRTAPDKSTSIVCISNVTAGHRPVNLADCGIGHSSITRLHDLLSGLAVQIDHDAIMTTAPYQTVWLSQPSGNTADDRY